MDDILTICPSNTIKYLKKDLSKISRLNVAEIALNNQILFEIFTLCSNNSAIKILSFKCCTFPSFERLMLGSDCICFPFPVKINIDEIHLDTFHQGISAITSHLIKTCQIKKLVFTYQTGINNEVDIVKCIDCSIVDVVVLKLNPLSKSLKLPFLDQIKERNLIAYNKCKSAAIFLLIAYKHKEFTQLSKDVLVLIGKMIWNTRETRIWL